MSKTNPDAVRLFNKAFAAIPVTLPYTYFWSPAENGDFSEAVYNRQLNRQVVIQGQGVAKFVDPQGRRVIVVDAGCGDQIIVSCERRGANDEYRMRFAVPADFSQYLLLPNTPSMDHLLWLFHHTDSLRELRQQCRQMDRDNIEKASIVDHVQLFVEHGLPQLLHPTPILA